MIRPVPQFNMETVMKLNLTDAEKAAIISVLPAYIADAEEVVKENGDGEDGCYQYALDTLKGLEFSIGCGEYHPDDLPAIRDICEREIEANEEDEAVQNMWYDLRAKIVAEPYHEDLGDFVD
jgi:hypothetical protein